MELIYMGAPLLFFLLCVIEVTLVPNNNASWTNSNYRKNCIIRQRPSYARAEEKNGLSSLDYVSEITRDINGLRKRTEYQYTYVKNS